MPSRSLHMYATPYKSEENILLIQFGTAALILQRRTDMLAAFRDAELKVCLPVKLSHGAHHPCRFNWRCIMLLVFSSIFWSPLVFPRFSRPRGWNSQGEASDPEVRLSLVSSWTVPTWRWYFSSFLSIRLHEVSSSPWFRSVTLLCIFSNLPIYYFGKSCSIYSFEYICSLCGVGLQDVVPSYSE